MRIISEKLVERLIIQDLRFIKKNFPPDPMPPMENKSYRIKNKIIVNYVAERMVEIWKSNDNGFVLSGTISEDEGGLTKP